ncbi:hypothetical protein Tco_1370971 [Tanacetum coccineum]
MELHDVSYGFEYVARPFLLFFSSENRLLYFRYRESDLAHLKLVFEFSIYNVWKSVEYGVSNELDTSRNWGFLEVRDTFDISRIFIFIQFLKRRIWSFWIRRMVLVVVVFDATIAPAAPATLNRQTLNAYTTTAETVPTPTNSSTMTPVILNTSHDVDELQQQKHSQQ